jgi:hypothetical protein
MVSLTSRRLAAPIVVACAGAGLALAGHVAARADTAAPTARAAADSGGLSVTPAILEHAAQRGAVGSVTVTNTTKQTLRISVRVRPWIQALSGQVASDSRSTLSHYVRATTASFSLAPGANRPIRLTMFHGTSTGSLYGSVDVLGKPTHAKVINGVIPQYRLITSLRLNPSRSSVKLRTGAAQIRGGNVVLPVRNTGNTIDPVSGSFRITGAGARSGTIAAVRVLPGKLVTLSLGAAKSLPKGAYTATASLTQAGHATSARTTFRIR